MNKYRGRGRRQKRRGGEEKKKKKEERGGGGGGGGGKPPVCLERDNAVGAHARALLSGLFIDYIYFRVFNLFIFILFFN